MRDADFQSLIDYRLEQANEALPDADEIKLLLTDVQALVTGLRHYVTEQS
ncbi:MAG: hypothetical protein JW993_03485 [Sedimentisphaerales bacterium]|nr:hypothetical protein [Sedimentisphaerales bacterium]